MRRITEKWAPAGTWLVLTVCALAAGGCQDWQGTRGTVALTPIQDVAEFRREVLQSSQPVIVDFYKDSCPTCVLQDGVLEGLAHEYQGRVKFVKFKVRESYMVSKCPEFMDEYRLFWVPTTVLFVNGKEQRRWELNHAAWQFRPALDAAGGRPPNAGPALAVTSGTPAPRPVVGPDGCIEGQGCPINRPSLIPVGKSSGAGAGSTGPVIP